MEIGPVSSVRLAPAVKSRESDLGLKDLDEIERPAGTGDETYSPGSAKAAAGFDDENSEPDDEEGGSGEDSAEASAAPEEKASTSNLVDYFA